MGDPSFAQICMTNMCLNMQSGLSDLTFLEYKVSSNN